LRLRNHNAIVGFTTIALPNKSARVDLNFLIPQIVLELEYTMFLKYEEIIKIASL